MASRLALILYIFVSRFRRIAIALIYGAVCQGMLTLGVGTMVVMMYFGMTRALGPLEGVPAWLANAVLLAQLPVGHSVLLTRRGRSWLARLAPRGLGQDLSTTTYATAAAFQVFCLFALWSPSGVVWWRAEGWVLWAMTCLYGASWLVLFKAMLDAGIGVQSGLLGWTSVLRGVRPVYPDMPTRGLFRLTRQPIYVGFTLTLWTVPTWTPDQLAVALALTAYCVIGPRFKERRFAKLFGQRFATYQVVVPYWLPRIPSRHPSQRRQGS